MRNLRWRAERLQQIPAGPVWSLYHVTHGTYTMVAVPDAGFTEVRTGARKKPATSGSIALFLKRWRDAITEAEQCAA